MKNPDLDVRNLIDTERTKQIARNRLVLGAVIDTLKLHGAQNNPLRGHTDDGNISLPDDEIINSQYSDGIFRHILRLKLATGDQNLKEAFNRVTEKKSRQAFSTSKTIPNELILLMGEMIKEKIVSRVKKSGK